jgi:hypothetical protein
MVQEEQQGGNQLASDASTHTKSATAVDAITPPAALRARGVDDLSHPVLEGKPNANHVRARISYSRTQRLHK